MVYIRYSEIVSNSPNFCWNCGDKRQNEDKQILSFWSKWAKQDKWIKVDKHASFGQSVSMNEDVKLEE